MHFAEVDGMDGMEWERTATKKTTPPKEDVKEDPVGVHHRRCGKIGSEKLGGNLCSRSNAHGTRGTYAGGHTTTTAAS